LIKILKLPKILCIDEFYFSKDNDNKYCCILVDWETKQIVDIIKNRQLAYLDDYFSKIPQNELKNVKYFVSDMYDGYATIKNKYFPKADHIIDLFHIVIQLNRVTNSIRCSVMKSLPDDSIEKNLCLLIGNYFYANLL
jgi:transposase